MDLDSHSSLQPVSSLNMDIFPKLPGSNKQIINRTAVHWRMDKVLLSSGNSSPTLDRKYCYGLLAREIRKQKQILDSKNKLHN